MSRELATNTDVFLTAPQVRQKFGVTDMTLSRWLNGGDSRFPRPIYISGRRYWKAADLARFVAECDASKAEDAEAARQRAAVQPKKAA